tara:strand:- start:43 stop:363 length:321 start_codon:yes stop_codon:yes gene_type:complete
MPKVYDNIVGLRDMTTEELAQYNKDQKEYQDNIVPKKLAYIKELRLQRLIETDYLANSDVTMPDNIKTWRQSLRDLPQNNTTETQYDALLARDDDGNLTNAIWSKP